ncbi:LOW QUALITY PROTEIN: hypothetical protein PHMEG_00036440 [Phytophthora megakarya]|uniref:Uncharacterized protein n=1 Tax=Phytophthora megakarya TaxID=4795 RepID=A0A225ULK2_9STRA|nr:LOW QUALITY PROTEIN: hypothetical protein PHMEG_00036440 [Phytophthora megakarya]
MIHRVALHAACGLTLLTFHELVPHGVAEMTAVSVCQDATFEIPTSRGAPCSGNGDQPLGTECPRVGDTAVDECYPYLDSFNGVNCIAKEDAQCVHLQRKNAWGCTFPSTWCSAMSASLTEAVLAPDGCPTWEFASDDGIFISDPFERAKTKAIPHGFSRRQ